MIAKTEGIHAWTSPAAGAAAIELGRVRDDEGALVWPRFTLRRVSGLGSTGEPEDNRDRPPGRALEIARKSNRRGKTVVYEGEVKARNLYELREAEALFSAAFDDLDGEGRMDVFWHPLLLAARPAFAGVPPKLYEARALTADIVDVQGSRSFFRPYVVAVRLSDRRYFDETSLSSTVVIAETETLYKFGALLGGLPADARGPVLNLTDLAPIADFDLVVQHLPSGKSLMIEFRAEETPPSTISLDWYRRTITDENGEDCSALLSAGDNGLWVDPAAFANTDEFQIEAQFYAPELEEEFPEGFPPEPWGAVATIHWEKGYY